jgi:hypothetical protein
MNRKGVPGYESGTPNIFNSDSFPVLAINPLAAGHGAHNPKRLCAQHHLIGQGCLWWVVRQILPAGEEPQEWPPLLRDVVADRPTQYWMLGLQCVQNRPQRGWPFNLQFNFSTDVRQGPQMIRKYDPDHDSV